MQTTMNLKDLSLEETTDLVADMGAKPFRAKQIVDWVFQKGVTHISEMTNLPKDFRDNLSTRAYISSLKILKRKQSDDGTTKYLFQLDDGNTLESVFLPHNYGNSVCVSTQVGCRMGCGFCASTIGGFQRNLTSGEIYDQILTIQQDQNKRVSSIVIMGSGEPLDNYEAVLKFIKIIMAPYSLNIGIRHITLSTCGLVPNINRLAEEGLGLTLSISLHAPDNKLRDSLMPINRKYPLERLIPACQNYIKKTGRRISFEYILMGGINDSKNHAAKLSQLIKGLLCHVNLIPVNPVKERDWVKPTMEAIKNFQAILEKNKIPATVRREMGADIDAACGQLRRNYSLEKTGGIMNGVLD